MNLCVLIDEKTKSDAGATCRQILSGRAFAISRCELVATRLHGKITMTLRGPETRATPMGDSSSDGEWFGILLKLGTFLPYLPTRSLTDTGVTLPEATGGESTRRVRQQAN